MRHLSATDTLLERYEVEDGVMLGIANEHGDITAYVERPDGTRGHAYGGPVYDPPEFQNVCEREALSFNTGPLTAGEVLHVLRLVCDHKRDMTPAECMTANAFARRVGWM